MGAYTYCYKCKLPAPAPWNITTKDLLMIITNNQDGITCDNCGDFIYYPQEDLIEELAERIGSKRT